MKQIIAYITVTIVLLGCLPLAIESGLQTVPQARATEKLAELPGHHVTIEGPTKIPVGGLAIFTVHGLKAGDPLSWVTVPTIQIADLIDRQGRPVLISPSNLPGTYNLILAFTDEGKVTQKQHTFEVHGPLPPAPPGPTPPGPTPPGPAPPGPTPPVDPDNKAVAATYVYEKDQHPIPAAVMSGLNKLNREKKIIATILEADTTDGQKQIPDQYKVAHAAAKEAGLPALVVTGAKGVIRVVKAPTTEQQVLEAAP